MPRRQIAKAVLEKLEIFGRYVDAQLRSSGHVAARTSQSFYKTHTYRIGRTDKNDWYARGLTFCSYRGWNNGTNYYIHICLN